MPKRDCQILSVTEDLNYDSVEAVLRDARSRLLSFPHRSTVQIDCSQVRQLNSAALAFLVEVMRHAKQRSMTLVFHVTPEIKALAGLSNLQLS